MRKKGEGRREKKDEKIPKGMKGRKRKHGEILYEIIVWFFCKFFGDCVLEPPFDRRLKRKEGVFWGGEEEREKIAESIKGFYCGGGG